MTLTVQHTDHLHADAVLADITRLRRAAAGRALVDAVIAAGPAIRIAEPEPVQPPNAWMRVTGSQEVTLVYDPSDWPCPGRDDSPASVGVLQGLLSLAAARLGIAVPP